MKKVYLYGKNPLKEAIFAYKSKDRLIFESIFLTKESSSDPNIVSLLQKTNLKFTIVTKEEIESMVGKDVVHQGVCASLIENNLYEDFETTISKLEEKKSLVIILNELQDPHNVGAIIRSAKAFNVDAIFIPEHNQIDINATVIKSATGMNFLIPIIKVGNINNVVKKLKENNFWVYGLEGNGDTSLYDAKFDTSTAIIIGSEGSGIKQKTLELCDFRLSIDINKECESLNASNAVAVTLFEWNRQNKFN